MPIRKSLLTVIVLALLGLFFVEASFFDQLGCAGQLVNINLSPSKAQAVAGERVIGQSFVAPYDHLYRVDLLLQTYERLNTHDVTLRVIEFEENVESPLQGTELFASTFNASEVEDKQWHSVVFPQVANSAGKYYFVVLQSPTAEPGNAITIGGIDKDIYAPGSAFLGPVPVPSDLAFRACFQMSWGQKLRLLAEQLTQNRPGVWGAPSFYLISVVIYGLLLAGFLWQLIRWSTR